MTRKTISGIMQTLLLIGSLAFVFNIRLIEVSGTIYIVNTIYIRADGSIHPPWAPISSIDNVTYTFTDNIYLPIRVQIDDIVIDGAGYTVRGDGNRTGIDLLLRNNVTVRNMKIEFFSFGIWLFGSSNISILGNTVVNNEYGIELGLSSGNNITANNIAANSRYGIYLSASSDNRVSENNVTTNFIDGIILSESSSNILSENKVEANGMNGISLVDSSNNTISENNITANKDYGLWVSVSTNNIILGNNITMNEYYGIALDLSSGSSVSANNVRNNVHGIILQQSSDNVISENNITANNWWGFSFYLSSNNTISENNITNNEIGILRHASSNSIYHNNFIDNSIQVDSYNSVNIWDDGYPSGGNYWSDYEEKYPDATELDNSGIWDTPYVIDEDNQDNYPLMKPWSQSRPVIKATINIEPNTLNLESKGRWATAYIELPEGYDVSDIDRATIMLNHTVPVDPFWVDKPLKSVTGNRDKNDIPYLTVKFDRSEVIESVLNALGPPRNKSAYVTLTITGQLTDGTLFEGNDTIRILLPKFRYESGKYTLMPI